MPEPIDIVMTCWNRVDLTKNTINYLRERTKHPYRLFVIDNASTDGTEILLKFTEKSGDVFHSLRMSKNTGIHMAWNTAVGLVESEYFITTDNDCYVPDLDPDWLSQLVTLMDNNPDYGAIALQPHMFLGCADPTPDPSGVTEVSHCGAVMRMMRKSAVIKAGGWERFFNAKRNHEELTVCSRLKTAGYKVGYASYLRCYHDFGEDNNWGYKEVHPNVHGHRIPGGSEFANGGPGEIWPSPKEMKRHDGEFDPKTWLRK